MNTNDIEIIREALNGGKASASTAAHFFEGYGHEKNLDRIDAALAALDQLEAQQPRVRYRSQVSGMWYETLEAAGDVDCVEVDGVQFCQENGVKCLTQQQGKITQEQWIPLHEFILRALGQWVEEPKELTLEVARELLKESIGHVLNNDIVGQRKWAAKLAEYGIKQ